MVSDEPSIYQNLNSIIKYVNYLDTVGNLSLINLIKTIVIRSIKRSIHDRVIIIYNYYET